MGSYGGLPGTLNCYIHCRPVVHLCSDLLEGTQEIEETLKGAAVLEMSSNMEEWLL